MVALEHAHAHIALATEAQITVIRSEINHNKSLEVQQLFSTSTEKTGTKYNKSVLTQGYCRENFSMATL